MVANDFDQRIPVLAFQSLDYPPMIAFDPVKWGVASIQKQNTNAQQGNGIFLINITHIFCVLSVMLHCLSHGSRNPGGLPRSMVSCFESRNREASDLPLDALL
jgi:hypothetical protein